MPTVSDYIFRVTFLWDLQSSLIGDLSSIVHTSLSTTPSTTCSLRDRQRKRKVRPTNGASAEFFLTETTLMNWRQLTVNVMWCFWTRSAGLQDSGLWWQTWVITRVHYPKVYIFLMKVSSLEMCQQRGATTNALRPTVLSTRPPSSCSIPTSRYTKLERGLNMPPWGTLFSKLPDELDKSILSSFSSWQVTIQLCVRKWTLIAEIP